MFNIIHIGEGFKFDFIPKKRDEYTAEQFSRKKYLKINGFHAWVLTAEDLILSKLLWIQDSKSAMHFKDLEEVLSRKDIDINYLKLWSKKLNIKTFNFF